MKERKGCIFSISQDNVPVAGCTISKDVVHQPGILHHENRQRKAESMVFVLFAE